MRAAGLGDPVLRADRLGEGLPPGAKLGMIRCLCGASVPLRLSADRWLW